MASKNKVWNIVSVIIGLAISVWGKPACRTRFRTEVVCVAGKDDYILQRGLVSENNNTIAVTLKDCRIIDVDIEAFKNIYNLEEIDMSRNKISVLKVGAFDGIPRLSSLRLSKNLLTSLPLGLFDNLPNLQRLDLSDNTIFYLVSGIFDNVPKLVRLELSGNAFLGKDLAPSLFSQNLMIKYLHFSSNNMSNAPDNLLNDIRELLILGLNNCSLSEVPKFATSSNLNTLKRLSIQRNKIKRLDNSEAFANLENLASLNLIGNSIEFLNESVFKPMSKLRSVDLSFNKINLIPENLFYNMRSLEYIYLSNNLIEIVPVNAFLGTRLDTLDLSENRISFLDKNFFSDQSCCCNKWLSTFYFKGNPFHCACLNEILNDVKRLGIKYDADTYKEQKLECLAANEVTCIRPMDGRYAKANDNDKLCSTFEHSNHVDSGNWSDLK